MQEDGEPDVWSEDLRRPGAKNDEIKKMQSKNYKKEKERMQEEGEPDVWSGDLPEAKKVHHQRATQCFATCLTSMQHDDR